MTVHSHSEYTATLYTIKYTAVLYQLHTQLYIYTSVPVARARSVLDYSH